MNNKEGLLKGKCEQIGVQLSQKQLRQFLRYYEILAEWNEVMNLTAITEYAEVAEKHFVDSLTLTKVLDLYRPLRIMDMGSGAGFPGIPLKIAFPELQVTLLDSLNKRISFLDAVIEELELPSIEAVHARAEDFAKKAEHREKYNVCVSRAVANLTSLSEYCLPYVKIGGCFVSYKAGDCEEEIAAADKAIRLLGGTLENTVSFRLPDSDISRTLIVIRKQAETPKQFPRKAGMPTKEPLG